MGIHQYSFSRRQLQHDFLKGTEWSMNTQVFVDQLIPEASWVAVNVTSQLLLEACFLLDDFMVEFLFHYLYAGDLRITLCCSFARCAICWSLKQFLRRFGISAVHQYVTRDFSWRSLLLGTNESQAPVIRFISNSVAVLLSLSRSCGSFIPCERALANLQICQRWYLRNQGDEMSEWYRYIR